MEKVVLQVSVKGVMPTSNSCAVFLGNDSKTFVIYVDQVIGDAIENAINDVHFERPQTHKLMITALDGLGAEIERIVINNVEDSTFYARLILSMDNELGHKIIEIDARPSDSLVLALNTGKPIYVARTVMDSVEDMTAILTKILNQGSEK
ncbi:MAG: bifunctional nuclease family protein [Puniceicoccaceae bacterium]|nr:bifunctional nuclease family protein [Puniceicoccaceae bacterium]